MKRVVVVGPDFVPSSLPPALRIRLFVRYLPEFGWRPSVITVDPRYYEYPVDLENERLLPDALEVFRTPALPASITRRFGVSDIGIRSLWHHWRALNSLCRRDPIDLVFIPVPPYVPMILGRLIYRRFRIPYVIDYIDPWVTEYYWTLPKGQRPPKWPLAHVLSRLLEPFALGGVAHIVGVSQGTTRSVTSHYPWLSNTETTEIPYGGEPADFEYLRSHPRHQRIFDCRDGFLHISYVGAYTPAMRMTTVCYM